MLYLESLGQQLIGWDGQSPQTFKHQQGKPVVDLKDLRNKVASSGSLTHSPALFHHAFSELFTKCKQCYYSQTSYLNDFSQSYLQLI
jgi:hypothetical protein